MVISNDVQRERDRDREHAEKNTALHLILGISVFPENFPCRTEKIGETQNLSNCCSTAHTGCVTALTCLHEHRNEKQELPRHTSEASSLEESFRIETGAGRHTVVRCYSVTASHYSDQYHKYSQTDWFNSPGSSNATYCICLGTLDNKQLQTTCFLVNTFSLVLPTFLRFQISVFNRIKVCIYHIMFLVYSISEHGGKCCVMAVIQGNKAIF